MLHKKIKLKNTPNGFIFKGGIALIRNGYPKNRAYDFTDWKKILGSIDNSDPRKAENKNLIDHETCNKVFYI